MTVHIGTFNLPLGTDTTQNTSLLEPAAAPSSRSCRTPSRLASKPNSIRPRPRQPARSRRTR